jgi:putative transposase
MKEHHPKAGLGKLCRLFGLSRQAYYQSQNRQADEALKEAVVLDMVREIRVKMPRIGTLKLHHMLKDDFKAHHICLGRDGFRSLLREHNLLVKPRKRYYVRTTDSDHPYHKWDDLLATISLSGPHQLWVSDITYLRSTKDGFLYLSLITDSYSRKIVGHHLSLSLSARGCVSALNKSIAQLPKQDRAKLIHHSDRGIQYCCDQYVSLLQSKGIGISMTQNGSPYDNALAERMNGILKTELGLDALFRDYGAALRAVNNAIDTYNSMRPHCSWKLDTPDKVHSRAPNPGDQPINPKQLSKQTSRKPKSVSLQ